MGGVGGTRQGPPAGTGSYGEVVCSEVSWMELDLFLRNSSLREASPRITLPSLSLTLGNSVLLGQPQFPPLGVNRKYMKSAWSVGSEQEVLLRKDRPGPCRGCGGPPEAWLPGCGLGPQD